ncbi:hypothetical protein GUITHDRAFT_113893 [Guillardia theta CCMP2712]|uniref:Uncharacterized protein n=1 Tax=Guillardia theta (strain CCMP2712) TaxID=905079 RepID=L1IVN4_GUITC|nr:hypothetical protein GUITHDRAFT_113893 [Guillardia theta CCMP2712]EKX39900.1 hypothetical protein GUITHDRAFT_113893 [Guillardia theta CCMP2712]|eukprot:XP_005826880.1 hypothetical protein GUITHDRAFT_113893 [Guillardia theta CCMP2712]
MVIPKSLIILTAWQVSTRLALADPLPCGSKSVRADPPAVCKGPAPPSRDDGVITMERDLKVKQEMRKRRQEESPQMTATNKRAAKRKTSSDQGESAGNHARSSWGESTKTSFMSHFEKSKVKGASRTSLESDKSGHEVEQGKVTASAAVSKHRKASHPDQGNNSKKRHERGPKGTEPTSSIHNHPFPTEYGDHFETSKVAIHDIAPILQQFAKVSGKQASSLAIYDPYYCDGAVIEHFRQEGFHNVHNLNVDCYQVWKSATTSSDFDIVVTNPPFSGDHKQKCLEHCVKREQAWMVLLPAYCATKNYFQELMSNWKERGKVFYGIPKVRYDFEHPEGTGHAVSPFFSIWFVYLGKHTEEIFSWYKKRYGDEGPLKLARTVEDLAANKAVDNRKRLNPRQRAALKKKKQILP